MLLSDVASLKSVKYKLPYELTDDTLRMLIPDTIKFAYVSRTQIQIHENSIAAAQKQRDMVDFSLPSPGHSEEDEHVLVLEFVDNSKRKRSSNTGHALSLDEVTY